MTHRHTLFACYTGYVTQAIVNNFAPLLFITFQSQYNFSLEKITLITTFNFLIQLTMDLLCAKFVDKIGYRAAAIFAHIFCATGLAGLAIFPQLFTNEYAGIIFAVFLYASGGGITEVIISPIVENCPTRDKNGAMNILHSFYCWGHMAVVILSAIFFHFAGISNWKILSCLWTLVPLFAIFLFSKVPIFPIIKNDEKPLSIGALFSKKIFWMIAILMLCAGASEQAFSQWSSAFMEQSLRLSKFAADISGPCAFAFFMGISRLVFGKFGAKISSESLIFKSALLCLVAYCLVAFSRLPVFSIAGGALAGFSVGVFWPGTFCIAAKKIPTGGTAMYALFALAGDLGCATGPFAVGFTASALGANLKSGIFVAIIFPLVILALTKKIKSKKK